MKNLESQNIHFQKDGSPCRPAWVSCLFGADFCTKQGQKSGRAGRSYNRILGFGVGLCTTCYVGTHAGH